MRKVVAASALVACLLLLGVWWNAARSAGAGGRAGFSASQPERLPGTGLQVAPAESVEGGVQVDVPEDVALFRELVRTREAALREVADNVSAKRGFLPTSPGLVSEKMLARRTRLVKERFAEMLDEVARKREVNPAELRDLYRRGLAEGWATAP